MTNWGMGVGVWGIGSIGSVGKPAEQAEYDDMMIRRPAESLNKEDSGSKYGINDSLRMLIMGEFSQLFSQRRLRPPPRKIIMTRTSQAISTLGSIFALTDPVGVSLLPPHSLEEVDSAEFLFTGIGNSYCCWAFTISVFPRIPLLGLTNRTAMTIHRKGSDSRT